MQVIGQYGAVGGVRLAPSQGPNPAFFIQMARPEQAKWLVDNLHRNIPLGLSTPINVRHHSEPDGQAACSAAVASATALVAKSAPSQAPWAGQAQPAGGFGPCGGYGGPMMSAPQAQCGMPGGMGGQIPSSKLYVEKLPISLTEEMVRHVFGQYGSLAAVTLLGDSGEGTLSAFVIMNDISQAKWLVENLHRNIPVGLSQPVLVSYAQQDEAPVTGGYGKASGPPYSPGPYGAPPPPAPPPAPPPPPPAPPGAGCWS